MGAGSTPSPQGGRTIPQVVPLLLAGGYVVTAQLSRPGGVPVTDTLRAEDGPLVIVDSLQAGGPLRWLEPYAGYVHLLPRMLASLVARLPFEQTALWIALLSSICAAACIVLLAVGVRRWFPVWWMPAAAVVAVGSLDLLATEVGANLANLHWFATLGLIRLVLVRIDSIAAGAAAAVAGLVLSLTDVFAIPLAGMSVAGLLLRWHRQGRRAALRYLPVAAAVCVGAVVQLVAVLTDDRGTPAGAEVPLSQTANDVVMLVLAQGVLGNGMLSFGRLLLCLALVAVVIVAAVIARHRLEPDRLLIAVALACAAAGFFAVSAQLNRALSERYAAIPSPLLVMSLLVIVAGRGHLNRGLAAGVAGAMVLLAAWQWPVTFTPRAGGPSLAEEIDGAAEECATTDAAAISISPPTAWIITLPCDQIFD